MFSYYKFNTISDRDKAIAWSSRTTRSGGGAAHRIETRGQVVAAGDGQSGQHLDQLAGALLARQ